MGKKSQSSLKFERIAFDRITRDGKTVTEVADEVGISYPYAYKLLDVVAEAHGMDRRVLLRYPHKEHAKFERVLVETPRINSPDEVAERYNFYHHAIDEMVQNVRELKVEIEEMSVEDDVELDDEFLTEVTQLEDEVCNELKGVQQ